MSENISRRSWLKLSALASSALAFSSCSILPKTEAQNILSNNSVRLMTNENPYGFSPKAKQAIIDSVELGNQYAHNEAIAELEKMIAKREGLSQENVIIGAGSGEVLSQTGAAYGLEGGKLVIADPSFPMVTNYAEKFGAEIIKVPLNEKHEHDLNEMEKRVSKDISLCYICNPNNPTGTILPAKQIMDFCESVSNKTTVFVDEAYLEYTDEFPRNSMVKLVKQDKNVIVTRTFSKIYGMAGMRVGYGLAKAEIAEKIKKFRTTGFNSLSINAAVASYQDTDFIKTSKKKNDIVHAMFVKEINKLNMPYSDSHGNFVWINGGKRFQNLHEKIRPTGLLVYNSRPPLSDWARITIGTEDNMKSLANAFRKL